MGDYQIERGVPLPTPHSQYKWNQMDAGDSFFVPIADKSGGAVRSAASYANRAYAPKWWKVCAVEGGHRVWRVR